MWQMLGFYPVATQPIYLITSPWFNNITMTVGDGKFLHITFTTVNSQLTTRPLDQEGVTEQKYRRAMDPHVEYLEAENTILDTEPSKKDNSTTPTGLFDIPPSGNPSAESWYVQSLRVNGKQWNRSWITHNDISNGGTLEFVLGSAPISWDTGDLPPSPGNIVL